MFEFFRSVAGSLLVAVPILSVPAIAVFGIPQFESYSASPVACSTVRIKKEMRAGESLSYISQQVLSTASEEPAVLHDLLSPSAAPKNFQLNNPRLNNRKLVRPDQQVAVQPSKQPLTWRGAISRLNELGIQDYRLMPGNKNETFLFVCSLSLKHRPRVTHRFAAESVEPLRAVQNVIGQIEERMAQQPQSLSSLAN